VGKGHLGKHGDDLLGTGKDDSAADELFGEDVVEGTDGSGAVVFASGAEATVVHAAIQAATPRPASTPWPRRHPQGSSHRTVWRRIS